MRNLAESADGSGAGARETNQRSRVICLPKSRLPRPAETGPTPDLYVPSAAILKAVVERPYQRLARVGYRTSACTCWVTMRVTQKIPPRQDLDCGGIYWRGSSPLPGIEPPTNGLAPTKSQKNAKVRWSLRVAQCKFSAVINSARHSCAHLAANRAIPVSQGIKGLRTRPKCGQEWPGVPKCREAAC